MTIEAKPNIFDGLEDWSEVPDNVPVETSVRISGSNRKVDLEEESRQGLLSEVVNKFLDEGKHVGVGFGRVPNEVRVFVAKHPYLISTTLAATVGAILVVEASKRSRKKRSE